MGGYYSWEKVSSYNTVTNSWTSHPDMNEKRYYHGCAFHPSTNTIIVAGGVIPSGYSTEVIDVGTWTYRKAGDLNHGRQRHALVTVGEEYPTVYAMGGKDGYALSSVEEWDPVKEEWRVLSSLDKARYNFAALAITESTLSTVC